MKRLTLCLCLLVPFSVLAQAGGDDASMVEDHRQFVSMPVGAQALMRQDMLQHMVVLNQLIGLLADNQLNQAADVTEKALGLSSMGKHRNSETPPGRYMPDAMHAIGRDMHMAASEFAEVARTGDRDKALKALQRVNASCLACHMSYRTR